MTSVFVLGNSHQRELRVDVAALEILLLPDTADLLLQKE